MKKGMKNLPGSKAVNSATRGVVLTGGMSRRMGRPKQHILLGDRTLLERALGLLREVRPPLHSVVVSGPEGIPDDPPGCGPLGGIRTILEDSPEYLLVMPVDMPFLERETLSRLMEEAGPEAVHFDGFPFPLLINNCLNVRQRLDALLQGPSVECSLRNFLKGLQVRLLNATNQDRFKNLNSPRDLADAKPCPPAPLF